MFDPLFFNIPPREAKYIDPQHRLFLEIVWQALKNANMPAESLNGSNTGVFCGITGNEYLQLMTNELSDEEYNVYMTTGNCLNFSVGRIAYILGLKGPSMAIDTACSSSLVSVHTACQSLRNKECDMAIAGGVNLLLSPRTSLSLIKGNMLSADGRCRTFSEDADGYARGEGCGIVILKRLSDARKDKDRILSLIKSSGVKHDGKKSGITVPISSSQKELIKDTLGKTDYKTEDICYVEAHGTGTPLGDPIELEALNSVYGKDRNQDNPLYIGSVKSNIGHLESASGIAGLIKVILSLYNNKIPPHLLSGELNKHFNWDKSRLKVVTENMDWPANKRKIAAVSSFGASGINAHMILEAASKEDIEVPRSITAIDYSFNKQRYWYKEIEKYRSKKSEKLTEQKNLNEEFSFSEASYLFSLHIDAVKTIKDHKIFGTIVLTGLIYLDTALTVVQEMLGDHSNTNYCLKNLSLPQSIVFKKDTVDLKLNVQIIEFSNEDDLYRVKMFPGNSVDDRNNDVLSSIDIQKVKKIKVHNCISLNSVIAQCTQEITGEEFYKKFWSNNFALGKTYHIIDKVWRNDGVSAVSLCRPLDFVNRTNAYGVNPETIIAYLNTYLIKSILPIRVVEEMDEKNMTFIGSGYGAITFCETLLHEEVYCYAELTQHEEDYSQFKGNIKISDKEGRVLCTIDDMAFTGIDKENFPVFPEAQIQRETAVQLSENTHPILGNGFSKLNKWSYQADIDYNSYPLIGDHQTFDYALLPGICFVDMVMIAMKKVNAGYNFTRLENLNILQPMLLHKGDKYRIKATLHKKNDHEHEYEIHSFSSKKNTINKEWALSTKAIFVDTPQLPEKKLVFDKDVIASFKEEYEGDEFYKTFWGDEFILGPSYYFIDKVWRRPGEALAVITDFSDYMKRTGITKVPANFLQLYMHLTLAVATIPDEHLENVRKNDATCISARVGSFIMYDTNDGNAYKELWAHARLANKDNLEEKWISDYDFFNEKGELVATCQGVEFQIMQKKALMLLKKSVEESETKKLSESIDGKKVLTNIIKRILGADDEEFDGNDELISYMDSIMMLELRNEIESNFSILLPLNNLIQAKSVEDLYAQLKTRRDDLTI
ncbi:MAG: Phthiocerol synthesis polyketide synthase type I PpsC [Firmicutes bacterium ADurb.Bin419]|nr:MAG: Phthiocerol synthesis polyketide synthase type I PpsC [Firmicutes bacterium ADurb.Bin419]